MATTPAKDYRPQRLAITPTIRHYVPASSPAGGRSLWVGGGVGDSQPKAPLCKGSCPEGAEGLYLARDVTYNPSVCPSGSHLPLHRGGFLRPCGARSPTQFHAAVLRVSITGSAAIWGLGVAAKYNPSAPSGQRLRPGRSIVAERTNRALCSFHSPPAGRFALRASAHWARASLRCLAQGSLCWWAFQPLVS